VRMVVHSPPLIHSTHLAPITTERGVNSTTTNTIDTASKIAKEVGAMLKDVPYVKAVAGIILQIITIREEIQTAKDRWQELVDKVLSSSTVILDGLLQVTMSPGRDQLQDMEGRLSNYHEYLMKILEVLKRYASKSMMDRIVNRRSGLDDLEKYNRLVDDFNTNFMTALQIEVRLHLTHMSQNSQSTLPPPVASDDFFYKPVLPPPPQFMIGRDGERSNVIEILLNKMPARIAILGAGGMGKTTLALSVLYDPLVIERYPSRYFVSCEAAPSVFALLGEMANVLRIPPERRDEHLMDVVLSSLRVNAILCLDNFESIWDSESTRSDVEDLLSHLSCTPELAMIITMRGTQRPSRVSWSKPVVPPLNKLNDASSALLLERICGKVDEFGEKLLREVDGIPLAVKLIGSLLDEGNETSKSLCARWERMQTKVVEDGGKGRLSNLDTSIHLSVHGPRMQVDPHAIPILAMLAILPDGFSYRFQAIDELQSHLPENIDLCETLLTLRRTSLVHVDDTNTFHRLRMLLPVRHFCQQTLQTPQTLVASLISFYAKMINSFVDVTDPAGHAVIPSELLNTHAVLIRAYELGEVDHLVVNASIGYTTWSLYLGNPVEEVLQLAIEGATGWPGQRASCYSVLASVFLRQHKLDDAKASLQHSIELHQQADDVLGEANNLHKLGEVYLRQNRLDDAKASFRRAAKLHRQAQSVLGEANDTQSLGVMYLQRDKLYRAMTSFEYASKLHRQAEDILGEANDNNFLGVVHLRQDRLHDARRSFQKALVLHREVRDVLGEANDISKLREVYLRQHKPADAQMLFQHAPKIHQQALSVLGEINDIHELEEDYLELDSDLLDGTLGEAHDINLIYESSM